MVNIRSTLAKAEAQSVISPSSRHILERVAKQLFYAERRYDRLLQRAVGVPTDEKRQLASWLDTSKVDQKRDDALCMLTAIRDFLSTDPQPMVVDFEFQATTFWERLVVYPNG